MALPALVGFGWLATVASNLFGSLFVFFGKFFTARFAILAAAIAAAIALTAAFYLAIAGVLGTIGMITPPYFSQALGLFSPSNAKGCISAILSVYVLRWLYDWQIKLLTMKSSG